MSTRLPQDCTQQLNQSTLGCQNQSNMTYEFSACPYQAWLILSPDTKSWILGPLPTPRTFTFPERVSGKMNKRMRGVINSEPIFNVVLKINFFRMHNLWTEGVHLCSIERGLAACNMQWYRSSGTEGDVGLPREKGNGGNKWLHSGEEAKARHCT